MIKKEKIVIISANYPYGEVETFLENEVIYLSNYFDITILPIKKNNKRDVPRAVPKNVSYHTPFISENYWVRFYKGIFNFSPLKPYLQDLETLQKKSTNRKYSFKLWFIKFITNRTIASSSLFKYYLKNESIKCIYFYWADFPIGLFKLLDKTIFIRVHGGEVDLKRNKNYIPMVEYVFVQSNKIKYLPISNKAIELLESFNLVNLTLNRLGVYDHGLNNKNTIGKAITIVSCSNMIGLKRLHLIVEALLNVHLDVKWIHFGDGPLMLEIIKLSKNLPPNIVVEFKGRVPNNKVIEFYKSQYVDLFINVSEAEGVPVSIMEALSFGIPCFATNVGGTSEIVDNSVGMLVEKTFELPVLVNYISKIRTDSKREELRENSRKKWLNMCNAEKNYSKLIEVLKL